MRDDRPSKTAAFVAACRGFTSLLPPDLRLARDPYGARFASPAAQALARAAERRPDLAPAAFTLFPRPLASILVWMQLRTRALDEQLLRFAEGGGRQVLLLGAGFDCRAARFHRKLMEATVYEVDHPATQERKRAVLAEAGAASARVEHVAWHFERDPMAELPARLAAVGHDVRQPTLTIWEGVTMYLSEGAIDASVRAVRALSAPGSRLAMTYFDRAYVDRPAGFSSLMGRVVARWGEPFRFGWAPPELPGWLEARGFSLDSDESDEDIARRLLPRQRVPLSRRRFRRIAVAVVRP